MATAETSAEPKPVAVIAGHAVFEPLGVGPLGTVYRATKIETGATVVFRGFHRPEGADDAAWQAAVDRFTATLEAQDRVEKHPNIQDVYEWGASGKLFYLSTEFFIGRTLRRVVDEAGPQPLAWALPVFKQVSAALEHARRGGLLHGDLTAHSILVLEEGSVRVINFGMGHTRDRTGSPYLAPEQLRGAINDQRTDVYAFGTLLYELLAGHPPFRADDPEALGQQILGAAVPPIAGQPAAVNAVLAKLLAKAPISRYESTHQAIADLQAGRPPQEPLPIADDGPPPVPWKQGEFSQGPGLYQFGVKDQDFVQAQQQLEAERAMARIRGLGLKLIVLALFCLATLHAFSVPRNDRYATVVELRGTPQQIVGGKPTALALKQRLDGARPVVLKTPPGAGLTLKMRNDFLKIGENSLVTVRRLGYRHGRLRSFLLQRGRVWAKVAPLHRGSRFVIRAKGFRTTVHGTLYGVELDQQGADITTLEGQVQVSDGEGATETVNAGQELDAQTGEKLDDPETLTEEEAQQKLEEATIEFNQGLLAQLGDLVGVFGENTIVAAVDGLTGLVGKGGPANVAGSAVQTVQAGVSAHVSLGAIATSLAMFDDGPPEQLTLNTLDELGYGKEETQRLLRPFKDQKLESYKRLGGDKFELTARVDDGKGTLLRWRNGKITEIGSSAEEDLE
ncbi:MAG: protein kinase [Armatimonadetes bacterium]|nr:protein kinase [Armatimonadota bacterium]